MLSTEGDRPPGEGEGTSRGTIRGGVKACKQKTLPVKVLFHRLIEGLPVIVPGCGLDSRGHVFILDRIFDLTLRQGLGGR